jgi:4-hydroxyphenylpyruvate dioxygenase-like putative hemolysin
MRFCVKQKVIVPASSSIAVPLPFSDDSRLWRSTILQRSHGRSVHYINQLTDSNIVKAAYVVTSRNLQFLRAVFSVTFLF